MFSGTDTLTVTDATGCKGYAAYYIPPALPEWPCLINPPDSVPGCGTSGNIITTSAVADEYYWFVQSDDPSWKINGSNRGTLASFTAGSAGSSARFILMISRNGCNQTCFYTISACKDHNLQAIDTSAIDMPIFIYPNPSTGSALTFRWQGTDNDYTELSLYDAYGNAVQKLYSGPVQNGQSYEVNVNAAALNNNVYIYRFISTKKKPVYGKMLRKP